jgi:6-pyruvoyl-tetrahydropterin synthase
MDFHELERLLNAIIRPMHNRHLNEVPPFRDGLNPSAENVALHIGRSLKLPPTAALTRVEVWETAACSAVYRPS